MQAVVGRQVFSFARISRQARVTERLDQADFQLANTGGIAAVGQQQVGLVFIEQSEFHRLPGATVWRRSDLKSDLSQLLEVPLVGGDQLEQTFVLGFEVLRQQAGVDACLGFGGDEVQCSRLLFMEHGFGLHRQLLKSRHCSVPRSRSARRLLSKQ